MITLANLHEKTEQEVFDHVADHLLRQGVRSVDEKNNCRYRDGKGNKCAAGSLIADSEYDPALMEGVAWYWLVEDGIINPAHQGLIAELQYIHDRSFYWKSSLERVAHMYNLSTLVLERDY